MRLYEGPVEHFCEDVVFSRLSDKLADAFARYYHHRPSAGELGAWQQSSNYLKNAIELAHLSGSQIIIEYELPYSSRRIDVLLFGQSVPGTDDVVLVELKQWSNDSVWDADAEGNVKARYRSGIGEVAHPSWQVEGYHFDLKDFLHVFQEENGLSLTSCVYCHNYARLKEPRILFAEKFKKGLDKFPIFAKEDVEELGRYLQARLSSGSGLEAFSRFTRSPIKPSKRLLEHTREMINERQIFTLIDDQIAAYNSVMHRARQLAKSQRKSVVIVKGGPGTGKSVIALEVMAQLLREHRTVVHATGASAFTNTLRKIMGRRTHGLFKFFNSFIGEPADSFDVLIADEAHRIREVSVDRRRRSRIPQIDELLGIARLCVFFIDEKQIVRPNEVGSVELIKRAADRFGVLSGDIAEFELTTQFRCSGSDAYLQWLDNTLAIRPSEFPRFDPRMEFRIFDDPLSMMNEVRERNREKRNSARITAGFCWPWSKPNPDGSLVDDVVVGNLQMPWEEKNQFWRWATHDSGMEQVGTVYTSQGFEFDYIAVIFGKDLVYDGEKRKWKAVPTESCDREVRRNNPNLKAHLASVYRVLLSRAHKGVYVYFMDKGTEGYFREQLVRPTPYVEVARTEITGETPEVISLEDVRSRRQRYKALLPVYSLKAAAGYFGKGEAVEPEGWIDASAIGRLNKDMFVARVVGRSMLPRISNGAFCVFRKHPKGSRQGKIVLVQYRGPADPETGGSYTVKRYRSTKIEAPDGTWRHDEITLEPLNPEFHPINLTARSEGDVEVIAELVAVLGDY